MFSVPEALLTAVQQFDHILQTDLSEFRKQYKHNDYSIETYDELKSKHQETISKIETLLFEDTLLLGPFVVHVGKLKTRILKKIN